jgi:hypothetical protein
VIVPNITFIRPIPVLGGSQRMDRFDAADGWVIEVHDYGVTISRPAQPEQNIQETPAFCTCGVGYSVPAPVVSEPVVAAEHLAVSLSDEAKAALASGDPATIAAVSSGQAVMPVVVVPEAKPTPYYEKGKGKR